MNNINDLRLNNNISNTNKNQNSTGIGDEFAKMLKNEIDDLNKAQESGEAAMTDIATGQVKDLH
ncbi:flagellar hook-basal body complex protein FliE, partial [Campylobacter coli]